MSRRFVQNFACGLFLVLLQLHPPISAQTPLNNFSIDTTLHLGASNFQSELHKSKSLARAVAAPIVLVVAGLYATTNNEVISRIEVREERNEWIPGFHHHADDYLQFAPIAAVYGLNAMGIRGKNNLINRTALLVKSELLVGVMTYTLKKVTAVPRPDTGSPTSFPSGHTAQAFAAATFMAKEYGQKSIWYSIGAYTLAAGIGTMRVMNNRHWASDVLVGAGVGILATNLSYLTHKTIVTKRNRSNSMVWSPLFGPGTLGAYMAFSI